MRKLRLILILLLSAAFRCAQMKGAEPAKNSAPVVIENLTSESEVQNNYETRTWTGRNGVIVRHGPTTLIANNITLNELTGDVVAEGAVSLQRVGDYWSGERLEYNFQTKKMTAGPFRAGMPPAFIS